MSSQQTTKEVKEMVVVAWAAVVVVTEAEAVEETEADTSTPSPRYSLVVSTSS